MKKLGAALESIWDSVKNLKSGKNNVAIDINKPGGLYNSKNTCYMNSIIQAIAASDILIKKLENLKISNPGSSSLIFLLDLLNGINEPNNNDDEILIRNTYFLEKLMKSVQWRKPSQQDPFDLLAALITNIHKDFKNKSKFEMPMKIKLIHEFQGVNVPARIQEHLGLSLSLCGNYETKPGAPLTFVIDQHFVPCMIDEDPKKTTKLSLFQKAPDILLIHIQANKWDEDQGEMIKPEYYILYEEKMTLWLHIVTDMNGEKCYVNEERIEQTHKIDYHLKAVIHHCGSISDGHYVTFRKWKNDWYLANDNWVEKKSFDNKICPYIMIYEKLDFK